jgi:hypothetical protein
VGFGKYPKNVTEERKASTVETTGGIVEDLMAIESLQEHKRLD